MEERPWCAAPSLPTGGVELHSPGNMPLRPSAAAPKRAWDSGGPHVCKETLLRILIYHQKGMLASFYEASIPFRFPVLAKADRLYELNSEEKCERRSTRCCRDLSISKNPPLTKSK